MNPVKVGMITSSYPRNKDDFAGSFVRSLAEKVAELGHDVHVLAACDPDVRYGEAAVKVKMHHFPYAVSSRLHVLGYGRSLTSDVKLKKLTYAMIPIYLTSAFLHFLALAARERFDVIHAHWVIPMGPVAALISRILRIPLVVSLHGSDVYLLDRNPLFQKAAVLTLNKAKVVTACSDDLKNRTVAAGVLAERIAVVPYGVDTQAFGGEGLDARAVFESRERLLGADGTGLVLGLGRLVQKKGFEYFIRAIPQVQAQYSRLRFVIAGDGDERARLECLARELGVEHCLAFSGAVPWYLIPYYLAACDIVVVPSIRDAWGNVDGLPNVLLEAMASGKPVVASSVAGIPSVVRDGREGYLVSEKSVDEIAEALKRLLVSSELRESMGLNARQRVVESFSWTCIATSVLGIYEQAMTN